MTLNLQIRNALKRHLDPDVARLTRCEYSHIYGRYYCTVRVDGRDYPCSLATAAEAPEVAEDVMNRAYADLPVLTPEL